MRQKLIVLLSVTILALTLAPLTAASQQRKHVDDRDYTEREDINQTYELAPGARVELSVISGSVDVETTSGNIAEVHIVRMGETRMLCAGSVTLDSVGLYDPSRAMVIDPVFVYSTSIGGFNNDSANAVAVDAAGNAYVCGVTTSLDFPAVNPFQPNLGLGQVAIGNPSDAFVAKLNPSGTALLLDRQCLRYWLCQIKRFPHDSGCISDQSNNRRRGVHH